MRAYTELDELSKLFFKVPKTEAMATDQPDTTSTVRTSTSYRSTAL